MKGSIIQTALLLVVTLRSLGQTSQPPDLTTLEGNVARQFNELRAKAGMKPLRFRRDIRMRMEACSVQMKGSDPKVESPSPKYTFSNAFWYLSPDPLETSGELAQWAGARATTDHVAVGVWFAKTETNPRGMYWVVVNPEHGALHEVFWSHFYLTDDFEYESIFDRHWKEQLPQLCRAIR